MAITISGENNNDRILAADGVIDQISGINIVGLITASHINVGNNIQLGNAGIITATTFVGNLTGNVNSTSPLLLQTGGSERFRITGNNELGIAGANYGSSGQVLTSGGSGSAVSWTTIPTQVTIANNADNRIITGGSGVNLNAEANLVWDGSQMGVGHNNPTDTFHVYHATDNLVARFESGDTGGGITLKDNTHVTSLLTTNGAFEINVDQGGDISGETIAFKMSGSEKLRITSSGTVNIGGDYTSTTSRLRINSTSYPETTEYLAVFKAGVANGNRFKNRYIKIRNNYTGSVHGGVPIVWEANADGSNNKVYGAIVTEGNGDIRFLNAGATSEKAIGTDLLGTISEKLRIKSGGNIEVSTTTNTNPTYIRVNSNRSNADDALGGIHGLWNGNPITGINFKTGADTTNKDDGRIQFVTYGGGTAGERMIIREDGNIGINETAPSEKLQIDGDILLGGQANSSESNYAIKFEYNNHQFAKIVGDGRDSTGYGDIDFYTSPTNGASNLTQRMSIRADGKIGIGNFLSDNPATALHINYDSNNLLTLDNSTASTQKMFFAQNGGTHAQIYATSNTGALTIESDPSNNHGSSFIDFRVDGGEKVRINSSGDLALLKIADNNTSSVGNHGFRFGSWGIQMRDTGGYNHWYFRRNYGGWQTQPQVTFKGNGYTGVGRLDPTHTLDVDGTSIFRDRIFSGTMSMKSIPFGANVTYDTGISINGYGYGGSILALCSRNYGAGTSTQAGLYYLEFKYDGNHVPTIHHVAGDSFVTFDKSASNTLTVHMGASNNNITMIESSVVNP